MKYAVIQTGSKQIRVESGKPIWIEKITTNVGELYNFNNVLALNDGKSLHIGNPKLNAEIKGIVQKHGRGPKLIIFRTKAKSNWKKKQGHRQEYTRVLITDIVFGKKIIDTFKIEKEDLEVSPKIQEKKIISEPKKDIINKEVEKTPSPNKKNDIKSEEK